MESDEIQRIKEEHSAASKNLEEEIITAVKEAIEHSAAVAKSLQNLLSVLAKFHVCAHVVLEKPRLTFVLFPLGTGEPHFLMRGNPLFTEKDKEEFKALGIKLDMPDSTPPAGG